MGLGPPNTRPDDICSVVFGSKWAYLLRSNGDGTHQLVGECYVEGVVDGRVIGMLSGARFNHLILCWYELVHTAWLQSAIPALVHAQLVILILDKMDGFHGRAVNKSHGAIIVTTASTTIIVVSRIQHIKGKDLIIESGSNRS